MCFDYDSYNEFSSTDVLKAKKVHQCNACWALIQPGEAYERQAGKCDGDFFVQKTCRRCCYDIVRVVEHELAEGCNWNESWPPLDQLEDYLVDSGLGRTAPEDVPADFQVGDLPKQPAQAT